MNAGYGDVVDSAASTKCRCDVMVVVVVVILLALGTGASTDLDAFIYIHFISLEFSSADLRILNEILRFIIYFNILNFF